MLQAALHVSDAHLLLSNTECVSCRTCRKDVNTTNNKRTPAGPSRPLPLIIMHWGPPTKGNSHRTAHLFAPNASPSGSMGGGSSEEAKKSFAAVRGKRAEADGAA